MSCVWLTVKEAADWLKVHPATLYGYIHSGKLKVNRPGGRGPGRKTAIRICLEELNRLGEESPNG